MEAITVDEAGKGLAHLLAQLNAGESLTITDSEGAPVAVLVSLRRGTGEAADAATWLERWDDLAKDVSSAWRSDRSALEILAEMRR